MRFFEFLLDSLDIGDQYKSKIGKIFPRLLVSFKPYRCPLEDRIMYRELSLVNTSKTTLSWIFVFWISDVPKAIAILLATFGFSQITRVYFLFFEFKFKLWIIHLYPFSYI